MERNSYSFLNSDSLFGDYQKYFAVCVGFDHYFWRDSGFDVVDQTFKAFTQKGMKPGYCYL